jgi:hypothetical protein
LKKKLKLKFKKKRKKKKEKRKMGARGGPATPSLPFFLFLFLK